MKKSILVIIFIFNLSHPLLSQTPDEFKPSDPAKYMWSKRIVGPISPSLKGDTATIYMNVNWDELTVDDNVIYSMKVIFE